MDINDLPPIALAQSAFREIPVYALTLPTGTTPGRQWRRPRVPFREGISDEWWLGEFGYPYEEDDVTHVPIYWRRIIVIGAPPQWPFGFTVPPRRMK